MNTVFFGASSYVIPLIELLKEKFGLALVITTEQQPTDPVVKFCIEQNIPYISVTSLNDPKVNGQLSMVNGQFAVLADFRLMVKQDVLDLFPKGIINIHPSLLPEYRGPTPGTTALLEGHEKTGVSLMILDTQLDHGPLLGQEDEHILPTDTSVTLYTRLFAKGAQLLEEKLSGYLDGKIKPTEQDDSKAIYSDFLTRESGFFEFSTPPEKEKLERMIRAYYPWPGVWTKIRIKNQELRIKLLPNNFVQLEGKKPISYHDFINGYAEGKEILEKLNLL